MHAAGDRPDPDSHERLLAIARQLAHVLDARWGIGPVRFGVETVLGFIPGAGDGVSLAVSAFQIVVALRCSLPPAKIGRMLAYVVLDLLFGFVPFVGDFAETLFKVHLRNQAILDAYAGQ